MGILPPRDGPDAHAPANDNTSLPIESNDDLDARRQELNRYLDEDEDTPFNDPWPDHLYK